MGKKPTKRAEPATPPEPEKVVLYVEVPPYIKEQMDALARLHNRKLTGETIQALQEYLERHGRWPPPAAPSESPAGSS